MYIHTDIPSFPGSWDTPVHQLK